MAEGVIDKAIEFINANYHLRWNGPVLELNGVAVTKDDLRNIKADTDIYLGRKHYSFARIINSDAIKDAE